MWPDHLLKAPPPNTITLRVSVPTQGFPGGSEVKDLPASVGDAGSIPGSGRSPGGGNGNSLQHSCLGSPWTEEPGGYSPSGSKELNMSEHIPTHITQKQACACPHTCAHRMLLNPQHGKLSAPGVLPVTAGDRGTGGNQALGHIRSPAVLTPSVFGSGRPVGLPSAAAWGAKEGRACIRAAQGGEAQRAQCR